MAAKQIAHKYEIIPSFMAKPHANLPGCGKHIHINVKDNVGRNLFYDENDKHKMSKLAQHFLAGQLHCLSHILPMYAPTINSFKRLVEGYWAPTQPTWGVENRTVSFRVIPAGPKATRIEVRFQTHLLYLIFSAFLELMPTPI